MAFLFSLSQPRGQEGSSTRHLPRHRRLLLGVAARRHLPGGVRLREEQRARVPGTCPLQSCMSLVKPQLLQPQADGTWTDLPRCIEHEPGIPEQVPGICPGIPGYCSLEYSGGLCEFQCASGPDIRSFCTPDGTWDPYPTCDGDIRQDMGDVTIEKKSVLDRGLEQYLPKSWTCSSHFPGSNGSGFGSLGCQFDCKLKRPTTFQKDTLWRRRSLDSPWKCRYCGLRAKANFSLASDQSLSSRTTSVAQCS